MTTRYSDAVEERMSAWFQDNIDEDAVPAMVWIDVETTGLDPDSDQLIEIAAMVTDKNGTCIDSFSSVVHPYSFRHGGGSAKSRLDALLDVTDPFVLEMHHTSGLWEDLANTHTFQEAKVVWQSVNDMLETHFGESARLPLSGSSVHFDKGFILKNINQRDYDRFFSHRVMDVSAIQEAAKLLNPELVTGLREEYQAIGAHRGLPDIIDSIEMYRFYVANFLWSATDEAIMREVDGK